LSDRRLPDGTVISSYFSLSSPETREDVYRKGSELMLGQIERVYFTDDVESKSKQFIEYDVSVRDATGGQHTIKNARKLELLGGSNDFDETILEPSEFSFEGKLDESTLFRNKNGTLVIVGFYNNSLEKPVIIGSLTHLSRIGGTKAEGIRKTGEYRGFQWTINKEGELEATFNGAKFPSGLPLEPGLIPVVLKMGKTGFEATARAILLEDTSGNQIRSENGAINISAIQTVLLEDALSGTLKIDSGKVALGNPLIPAGVTTGSKAEIFDMLEKSLDSFIVNAPTIVSTAVGPGSLSSVVVTALIEIKALILLVKGTL